MQELKVVLHQIHNALTAKNHDPVQLNRDNDYIRMD
ncbi:hypothetical protein PSYAE_25745 [Pseudomonas amygdali pv. aesculi str. 0893_23]|nr:hypothetical protein PSYAE_25745 [Pseudomonas amygdali pv. aesculi str. 0893_23]KPW17358.1 Uncharacterized protein ALO90_04986 [Pseudomonas amygdali pv. aesculi]